MTRTISLYTAIVAAAIIIVLNPLAVDWLGLPSYRRYSFLIDIYAIVLILSCVLFLRKKQSYLIYFSFFLIIFSPVYAFTVEIWLIQRQFLKARPATHIENTHQRDPALGWSPIPNAVGRHTVAGNFDVEYRIR